MQMSIRMKNEEKEENRNSDEDADNKPYESLDDWKKEVSHLKWPSLVLLLIILVLISLIQLKII